MPKEDSDRRLLELAAKAIGEKVFWDADDPCFFDFLAGTLTPWNPLTNDGDAFRLAVKLRLDVLMDGHDIQRSAVEVTANTEADLQPWASETLDGGDPYAATRRAIVRVAAEIGLALENEGKKNA